MKYNEIFTTDKNIIDNNILAANTNLDSSIVVMVNEIVQNDFSLADEERTITTEIIDNNCCLPFLFSCYHNESTVYISNKFNLIMFLQNLSKDEITSVAGYQNIYYRNRIFIRVMEKELWLFDEKKHITTWVYDNICIYLYKLKYEVPSKT